MINANCGRYVFIFFIFSLVINTRAAYDPDDSEGTLLNTQYAVDEFYFIWKISNFSHIFDDVTADFNLSLTAWTLRLSDKRYIFLERRDEGEPVNLHVVYDLKTEKKIYAGIEMHKIMKSNRSELKLFDLAETGYLMSIDIGQGTSAYEHDILKLRCVMKVLGPPITKVKKP